MALTYSWKVTSLRKGDVVEKNLSDVIVNVRWTLTGTDEDGNTGKFDGATPLDLNAIDPNNFTPLNDLTEEQVLEWVQAIVTVQDSYMNHINEIIYKEISKKKIGLKELNKDDFPWSSSANMTHEPAPVASNTIVNVVNEPPISANTTPIV